jgi:hypothetical protein
VQCTVVNEFKDAVNFKPLQPRQQWNSTPAPLKGWRELDRMLHISSEFYLHNKRWPIPHCCNIQVTATVLVAVATGAQALLQSCGMFPWMCPRKIICITLQRYTLTLHGVGTIPDLYIVWITVQQ